MECVRVSFARPVSFSDKNGRAPQEELKKATSQLATVEGAAEVACNNYRDFIDDFGDIPTSRFNRTSET